MSDSKPLLYWALKYAPPPLELSGSLVQHNPIEVTKFFGWVRASWWVTFRCQRVKNFTCELLQCCHFLNMERRAYEEAWSEYAWTELGLLHPALWNPIFQAWPLVWSQNVCDYLHKARLRSGLSAVSDRRTERPLDPHLKFHSLLPPVKCNPALPAYGFEGMELFSHAAIWVSCSPKGYLPPMCV